MESRQIRKSQKFNEPTQNKTRKLNERTYPENLARFRRTEKDKKH